MFASALDFRLVPIARDIASVELVARISTSPVEPVSVRPSATVAVFDEMTTLTEIAAATPTPPEPWPDWPLDVELAPDVCELMLGSVVDEPVFPESSLPAVSSEFCELLLLPPAPAFASATLAVDEDASISTESPARFRSVKALVVGSKTTIATAAPTATSSPPASASALVVSAAA